MGRNSCSGTYPAADIEGDRQCGLVGPVVAGARVGLHGRVEQRGDLQELLHGVTICLVDLLGV